MSDADPKLFECHLAAEADSRHVHKAYPLDNSPSAFDWNEHRPVDQSDYLLAGPEPRSYPEHLVIFAIWAVSIVSGIIAFGKWLS